MLEISKQDDIKKVRDVSSLRKEDSNEGLMEEELTRKKGEGRKRKWSDEEEYKQDGDVG